MEEARPMSRLAIQDLILGQRATYLNTPIGRLPGASAHQSNSLYPSNTLPAIRKPASSGPTLKMPVPFETLLPYAIMITVCNATTLKKS